MANSHIRTGKEIVCKKEGCCNLIYVEPYLFASGRKKFCSKQCLYSGGIQTNTFKAGHAPAGGGHTGHKHSGEARRRISEIQRERNKHRVPDLIKRRERDYKKKIRQSFQWKDWRTAVFARDSFTCKECGVVGGYLEPHHIIPVRSDMDKLFDTNNGITLCRPCHRKTVWREEEFAEKYFAILTKGN